MTPRLVPSSAQLAANPTARPPRRRGRLLAAGLVLLGALVAQPLVAATWYVDNNAAGSNTGTSPANAWRRLADVAWAGVQPGDVVAVRGGPYNERWTIGKGGASPSARIVLQGVGSPVIRGINGGSRNFIAVHGFEITHTSTANNYNAIHLSGATGWLIQDNYIHHTYYGGVSGAYGTVNSNHIIRANTFDDICAIGGGASSAAVISMFGDYNLIEYNQITKSLDRVRAFGAGNIVRNNYFGPTDSILYPNTSPYPHHTDSFQSYPSSRNLSQLLYERNWDVDNVDSVHGTNAHGLLIQDQGENNMHWAILRFNVLSRTGGPAYQFQNFDRVYGYNNTSLGVQSGASSIWRSAVTYDTGGQGNLQDWRNNSWSYSPNTMDTAGIFALSNRPTNFTADYQHSYQAGVLPGGVRNLASLDPLFKDRAKHDFTLSAASPLRGAGGPLTTAVTGGSNSTTLQVMDGRRLFDGWGMAEGDEIRIGAGALVRVTAINYNTNVATLAAPRYWNAGDPVSVKGMEDIGALPGAYAQDVTVTNTTATSLPGGTVSLTATVNNTHAVRGVEFLVDGLPVGMDYDAPYAVSWVSDGLSHTVEARAYSAWASDTLYARHAIGVAPGGTTAPVTTVEPPASSAPAFSTHPVSQTVAVGGSVTFTVAATGSPAPTYQWRKDGVNVAGATAASYTIPSVSTGSAGSYSVVATNSAGSAWSSAATLTVSSTSVSSAPAFTTHPVSQTVASGGAVTFTAVATGSPAPSYQWRKEGVDIAGATGASYTIPSVSTGNAGSYNVKATNTAGSAWSSGATLTVTTATVSSAPVFTTHPASQTASVGGSVTFTVAATGSPAPSYQWRKDGVSIAGATGTSYTIPSVSTGSGGNYNVVATNTAGSAWSSGATLTVTTTQVSTAPALSTVRYDYNGDGQSDLLWQSRSTGAFSYWLMNGATPSGTELLGTVPLAWELRGSGDFNGSGHVDLVWHNRTTGACSIWLMSGQNAGAIVALPSLSSDWQIAALADLNGDRNTDILVQNTRTREVRAWYMAGTAVATNVYFATAGRNWRIRGAGDFNQDGQADLLWQNTWNGEAQVQLMAGRTVIGTTTLLSSTSEWQIGGTGDFNRDGRSDIVWQSTRTGERHLWLMSGVSRAQTINLGVVPTDWEIRN